MLAFMYSVTGVTGTIPLLDPSLDWTMSSKLMPRKEKIRKTIAQLTTSFNLNDWVPLQSALADVLTVDYLNLFCYLSVR